MISLVTGCLGSLGTAPAAARTATQTSDLSSKPGHYVSQTHGYEIPYDEDAWNVNADVSFDGVDTFAIVGDVGTVMFIGIEATGSADECLEDASAAALAQDDFRDYDDDVNADGEPYGGTGLLGPYTGFSDGSNILYLECGLSPDDDVALIVRFIAARVDFNEAIESVDEILSGIVWDDGKDEGESSAGSRFAGRNTSSGGGDIGESESSTNRYVDEDNGWSLTWSDEWEQVSDFNQSGVLGLRNGDVDVLLYVIENMSNADDCLDLRFERLTDAPGVSNIEILRRDGRRVSGGDESVAYIAYIYDFTSNASTTEFVDHYDCRILPSGNDALMMSHIVVSRLYDEEAEAVAALLEGLTIDD